MRMYTYLVVIVGLMIMLNFAGINTASGVVIGSLDIVNHPELLTSSTFYLTILGIFTGLITVGSVLVGSFSRTPPESYLMATLCGVLLVFVGDIISVVMYARGNYETWVANIVLAILAPLAVGYILSVVEFWRGTA